ncbi:MAG: NUDIX hydrolase [Acidimicrobiia bacterium]
MNEIEAAGGIVRRLDADGTPRVAIVHRPQYDDWSFPKGKREPHEKLKATAKREVREELGGSVQVEHQLESISYFAGNVLKTVHYWLMAWCGDEPCGIDPEVDAVRWCTVDEARTLLSYPTELGLLAAIDPATRPGRVWLIRHAKAGSRYRFDGPDHLRPLTSGGQRQANALTKLLGHKPIRRLASSPYTRCVDTVTPLAHHIGCALETDARLGEGWTPTHIYQWCAQPEPAAICTHGDLIETFLGDLVASNTAPADLLARIDKGAVWQLDTAGGSVIRVSYTPNPES